MQYAPGYNNVVTLLKMLRTMMGVEEVFVFSGILGNNILLFEYMNFLVRDVY
jgi:hypothetical protein